MGFTPFKLQKKHKIQCWFKKEKKVCAKTPNQNSKLQQLQELKTYQEQDPRHVWVSLCFHLSSKKAQPPVMKWG